MSTGPGGVFARIEEAGIWLARIREEMSARTPTTAEAVTLKLPEGTPVIELIRTAVDDAGSAAEVMVATIASDRIALTYDFPIPD